MIFTAVGTPAPKGSKRHMGHGVMIESSEHVKPFMEAVKWAAIEAMGGPGKQMIHGPVYCRLVFTLAKPKKSKFTCPATGKDQDKLTRCVYDALTQAGVWEDDSRVVDGAESKVYPGQHPMALDVPGVWVHVEAFAGYR